MTGNKEPGFVPIKPAKVDLTAGGGKEQKRRRLSGRPLLWSGVGAVLGAALLVFLLLPRWLPDPAIDPGGETNQSQPEAPEKNPAPTTGNTPQATDGPAATVDAPWRKAQRFSMRKDSQATLQELLDTQKALEQRGVNVWGRQEYQRALEYARSGDAEYSRRNFSQAHDQYAAALDVLNGLLEGVEQLFAESMKAGNAALAAGDADAASAAFNVALAIDSIDREALLGMERAGNLTRVMALIEQGDALLQDGKPEQARDIYRQALETDTHSARARQQLELANTRINDNAFNLAMSSGFRLLEQERYEQAREAFNQALRLKPRSRAARDGVAQATHRITSTQVSAALTQAQAAQRRENWQGAIAAYEAALKLDSSLGNALEGKQQAALRAEIHTRLEQILAQPERLFDRGVYDEVADFRNKIRTLSEPGPILSGQLEQLERILVQAATPVTVQLHSDNQTRVTLYRVGELGFFTSKVLSLRPGRYVAVGHRDGYRDVRVEFFVDPDKAMEPVVVNSSEKIALGK